MKIKRTFSLDKILIKPKYSRLEHRRDVDLTTNIGNDLIIDYPIISAAMNTITEWEMANQMQKNGCWGILHRYMSFENRIKQLKKTGGVCGIAISSNDHKFVEKVMDEDLGSYFVMDVAHGHMEKALKFGEWMSSTWSSSQYDLIGGNIVSREAAIDLAVAGFDGARIGIGEGSVCTTRQVAGVGVPLASALLDISKIRRDGVDWFRLIVDGGVKNTGNIVKCLALGADAVITGYLFAGAKETPNNPKEKPIRYYGMASKQAMVDRGYFDSIHIVAPEGKELDKDDFVKRNLRRPVKEILDEIINGIKIGFSYVGARTIPELREKAEFMVVN